MLRKILAVFFTLAVCNFGSQIVFCTANSENETPLCRGAFDLYFVLDRLVSYFRRPLYHSMLKVNFNSCLWYPGMGLNLFEIGRDVPFLGRFLWFYIFCFIGTTFIRNIRLRFADK